MKVITVQDLKNMIDTDQRFTLIDVREEHEHEFSSIQPSILMPLSTFETDCRDLDPDKDYVVYCKMGGRSAQAATILDQLGFKNVSNLEGGITSWSKDIDPEISVL